MAEPLSYFAGRDGFNWFIGVCEDRDDPIGMGRIRVRVFGVHTNDLVKLPTIDLPWSQVVLPPNAKLARYQTSRSGQWVFGFFRDPDLMQEPIVLGILPAYPMFSADPNVGFNDPNSENAPQSQDEKYRKQPDYESFTLHAFKNQIPIV